MKLQQWRMSGILVLAMLASSAAQAANWYVAPSPTGDDLNAGNIGAPFATIQKGIDSAAGGGVDTVYVAAGTYTLTAQIDLNKAVTVQSLNGATNTIIDANTSGASRRCVDINVMAGPVLDGFTLKNGWTDADVQGNGGGVRMNYAGTVRNCIIEENRVGASVTETVGGGLKMSAGLVENCIIRQNRSNWDVNYGGGGVYMDGGTLRNCLIWGNTAQMYGGGVFLEGGTVESCTITRNYSAGGGGGGIGWGSGTKSLLNSIVYFNNTGGAGNANVYGSGGSDQTYSCAPSLYGGAGVITSDPTFTSAGSLYGYGATLGDPRLQSSSPCKNTGSDQGWMGAASDLDGNARLSGTVDMGAYEFTPPPVATGPTIQNAAGGPTNVQYTSAYLNGNLTSTGTAQTAVWVFWGDNDGTTNKPGAGVGAWDFGQEITNNAAVGAQTYQVSSLSSGALYYYRYYATNSVSDDWADSSRPFYADPNAADWYVHTGGSDSADGRSWPSAFLTITQAIAAATAGDLILVSNGTYAITAEIALNKAVTLRSLSGATGTTIDANATSGDRRRVVNITVAGAVLDGFTIREGYVDSDVEGNGGGVRMVAAGSVLNSIIEENVVTKSSSDCWGGGVRMSAGMVSNCIIRANRSLADVNYGGGGVYMDGGTLRGCLVHGNAANAYGGGVYQDAGTLESCTITRNYSATGGGGGVAHAAGTVLNSIIYSNTTGGAGAPDIGAAASATYSCAPLLTGGTGNITNDPQFVTAGSGFGYGSTLGDPRLPATSPCKNTGSDQGWMSGATDLDGNGRLFGTVDMGAYENQSTLSLGPTIENAAAGATNVTASSAYLNGNLTSTGTAQTAVWVYWGDNDGTTNKPGVGGDDWDFGQEVTNNGAVGAQTYQATSLTAGTLYYYRYYATNSVNDDWPDASTNFYTVPSAPTATAASSIGTVSFEANWSTSAGATNYLLDVATDNGFTSFVSGYNNLSVGNVLNRLVSGLTQGTPYYYRVRAQNSGGVSGNSGTTTVTTATGATTWYVAPSGNDGNAGTAWSVPFATIQRGLDAAVAGETVLVSNGTYTLLWGSYAVRVTNAVTLKSLNGAAVTIIDANATITTDERRALRVTAIGAVVEGFTLTGGIVNGLGGSGDGGAGLGMSGNSTVRDCIIEENVAYDSGAAVSWGGGVAFGNGVVERCIIRQNRADDGTTSGGAGVYMGSNGVLRGCLIYANAANAYGGGVYTDGGLIESCTITRNTAGLSGGGVSWANYWGTATGLNSIVYFNTGGPGVADIPGSAGVAYCCAPLLSSGTGNITGDPLFGGAGSGYGYGATLGNPRLAFSSPCRNTGLNQGWMGGAFDLDGTTRVFNYTVDMGAYENAFLGTLFQVK